MLDHKPPNIRFLQIAAFEVVEKPVDNFSIVKTESDSAMKLYWQGFHDPHIRVQTHIFD